MTASFHTLGCKLNYTESSTIIRMFTRSGYTTVAFGQPADVTVINTCTVTDQADHKCRQAISRAVKASPHGTVAVIGCFSELKRDKIAALPGVKLVLGNSDKFSILTHLDRLRGTASATPETAPEGDAKQQFFPACTFYERTRSFLKIQDGCDYRCAYCTIPAARGQSRSASIEDTVQQARIIAGKGIAEIVLTGVNIGDFGRTNGESFLQLLQALNRITSLKRIRIGSIEPNLLTEEIIAFMAASPRMAQHFHIPLQSGCNRILELMGRRYRRELFAEKVKLIHCHMPRAAIGTDVITGFPGETAADFDDTSKFINRLSLSYLHLFPYSARPGTPAAVLPNMVKAAVADMRSDILRDMSEAFRRKFYRGNIGVHHTVIYEQRARDSSMMTGFTGNYIRVETPYSEALIGRCAEVIITGIAPSGNAIAAPKKEV